VAEGCTSAASQKGAPSVAEDPLMKLHYPVAGQWNARDVDSWSWWPASIPDRRPRYSRNHPKVMRESACRG